MAAVSQSHIESGLSPPYDDSEMDELFPDLVGVEMMAKEEYNKEMDMPPSSPENSEHNLLNYLMRNVNTSTESQENDMLPDYNREAEINDVGWKETCVSPTNRSRQNSGMSGEKSRGPSPTELEENETGLNRNALMARLNRQKKKKYMQELETSVKSLKEENVLLKQDKKNMTTTVGKLETEVRYLKSIIANQSELSSLLQNIGVTGLRLHSSFPVPHKAPLTQSNSKLNFPMKRLYEPESNHESFQSEIDSESETVQSEQQVRGKYCPTDHDYTISVSSKTQNKVKKHMEQSENEQSQSPPTKFRKTNNQKNLRPPMPPMTCYAQTVATKSGQTVIKTGAEGNCGDSRGKRPQTRRATRAAETNAGVCLHVSSGCVSLEFCAHCSNRAQAAVTSESEEIIEVVD